MYHFKAICEFKYELRSSNLMILKINRAPLQCYFKICASYPRHRSIQTGVTVRKCQSLVKIGNFLSCVTLTFDGWPWKVLGHLYFAISIFAHRFISIGQFKLELQSGNDKFGSKSAIFCPSWPSNLMDDPEKQWGNFSMVFHAVCIILYPSVTSNWSYSLQTPNLGQNRRYFVPCGLEIWPMTLKNNRAPLLCDIKLCISSHCHMWVQTGVTVQKRLNWVLTSVTLTFLTLTVCTDITFVNGNNSWKFHDDTITGTLWKRCNRHWDRRTDGRTMDCRPLDLSGTGLDSYGTACMLPTNLI